MRCRYDWSRKRPSFPSQCYLTYQCLYAANVLHTPMKWRRRATRPCWCSVCRSISCTMAFVQAPLPLYSLATVVIERSSCWSSPKYESDITRTDNVNVSPTSSAGEQNWKFTRRSVRALVGMIAFLMDTSSSTSVSPRIHHQEKVFFFGNRGACTNFSGVFSYCKTTDNSSSLSGGTWKGSLTS